MMSPIVRREGMLGTKCCPPRHWIIRCGTPRVEPERCMESDTRRILIVLVRVSGVFSVICSSSIAVIGI